MFLKKSTVRKNGKVYSYYKLVSSYKDSEGRSKHKLIKHLGILTDEEADRMRSELREQSRRKAQSLPTGEEVIAYAFQSSVFMLREIQLLTYAPYTQKEWNVAEGDMLLVVREGQGEMYANGHKYELGSDSVMFCPAASGMFLFNPHPQKLVIDRIVFEIIGPDEPAGHGSYRKRKLMSGRFGQIRLHAPYHILQLTRELIDIAATEAEGPTAPFRAQLLFYELLHAVFHTHPEQHRETGSPVERASAYMRAHVGDELSRDRIARLSGVSPEHLSRLFKKEKGVSFSEYLSRLRIKKARELLQLSSSSVGEVAREVGIPSEYYFSRKFKQLVGVSPSVYVQQPKRYMTLMPALTSFLLTMGIVPTLGAIEPWMQERYARHLSLSGFRRVEGWNPTSTENLSYGTMDAVDLILCYTETEGSGALEETTPVLRLDLETLGWREQFSLLADLLGRQTEAEAWLREHARRIAAAKTQLAGILARGDTVAIFKIVSEKIYVYGDKRGMSGPLVYQDLQLRPPEAVKREIIDQGKLNLEVPVSRIADYAADYIVVVHYPTHWQDQTSQVLHSEEWRTLPAVRQNQVFHADVNLFYNYDPLSQALQLEALIEWFSSHSR
ncbi:helix-turn-helix domain-containing protein [Paenibacillus filicis]|uniref:Helix-turn-helix domain-containing protein n=1 Tax=Paenibacillus filicis TaxID=669464 RepID=A0ABU9DWX3_9BACL